ncbi:MAG: CBS domain-containing protein [Acidobacteriota bacterium]|jgi:CBS domain-containing protein
MKVRDIMKREPCVCSPGDDLAAVGRRMAEGNCGFLPVIGDDGRVVGVITDRDVCLALTGRDHKPSELQVRLVMSGEVYGCREDDDIRRALRTMRERRVRRLPVLDAAGRLRAILSLDDVVLEAQAVETEAFKGPFYSDITQTLKEINLHRAPAAVA